MGDTALSGSTESKLLGRRFLSAALILILELACSGCANKPTPNPGDHSSFTLSVSPGFPTAAPGTTGIQFTAVGVTEEIFVPGGPGPTTSQDLTNQATWTSSAPTVATIDGSGVVSTHTSGQTTITASYRFASAMTTLFVGNFPQFVSTADMTIARQGATATLLNNGNVLVAGGETPAGGTDSAEVYDPSTSTFRATGSMTVVREGHTATLLNNGKVLILGGANPTGLAGLTSAEVYDPLTGTFSATGGMAVGRYEHTATLLNNGKVLVAGGAVSPNETASAEVYDPSTGTFSATGSMTMGRYGHTATLLNNGTVLIAAGVTFTVNGTSAELYDPATGSFSATGNPTTFRWQHTATLLNTGRVLLSGGIIEGSQDTSSAELYDPASGTFSATGSMLIPRDGHTATLLNDGEVLVAGGAGYRVAELYDPTSGQFSVTGSLLNLLAGHTATRLTGGTILIGGGQLNQQSPTASAEVYQPSSLIPAGLVSITVTPPNSSIVVGTSQTMIANGTFSNGSVQQLASVTWSSSSAAIASISNDASNSGVALGIAAGTTTIIATTGSVSGSAILSVH